MEKTNKIYVLPISDRLDVTLKNFEQQLAEGEEIIDTSVAEKKLIVTTKRNKQITTNRVEQASAVTGKLLLD